MVGMSKSVRTLLNLKHDELKTVIIRLLRSRVNAGGRGSIKRSVLQRELTRLVGCGAVLGNARGSVEANLTRAISALRREDPPRLQRDKGDDMVRLSK